MLTSNKSIFQKLTLSFFLLICLWPSAPVQAVLGTNVIGMGNPPQTVTITFPDGTDEEADTTRAAGPVFFQPVMSQPGATRIVFDLNVNDGQVILSDPSGKQVSVLDFIDGEPQRDLTSPHTLADYLNGLLEQSRTDITAIDTYDNIWAELSKETQTEIKEIWEAREVAANQQMLQRFAVEDAMLSGQQWATNTANVLVGAHLQEQGGVRAEAGEKIQQARQNYGPQITELETQLTGLQTQLAQAIRDRDRYQANLTSHLKSHSWWAKLDFTEDRRSTFLEGRISSANNRIRVLRGQIAATSTALATTRQAAARYEQAITLNAAKNDAQLRAQAETQRFNEALQFSQELATKRQQFVEGHNTFQTQFTALDNKIKYGTDHDLTSSVEQWEKDKVSLQSTYDLWLSGMQVAIQWRGRDLHNAYTQNAADGIGPTNSNQLRTWVVEKGLEVGLVEQVDQTRVDAAAQSSGQQAQGALGQDIHAYTWRDFALDYSDEFRTTFSSWDTFSGRYGAFWGGVGRGTKDAFYDIYVLGKEGVDTVWEAEENAINYYFGTNSNVFGGENLDLIFDLSNSASNLNSQQIYETTQGIINWADRRFEQQAGSGEKGLRQALGDAGYLTGTVAGFEESGVRLVVLGTRYGAKAVRTGRLLNVGEDVVDTGADAARLVGGSTDANRAADVASGTSDSTRLFDETLPLPDSSRNPGLVDADGTGTVLNGDSIPTTLNNVPGATGAGALTPPGRAPPLIQNRGGAVTIAQNGDRITLTHSSGRQIELGPEHRLGKPGATSTAYVHPDNPNVVIKITRPEAAAGLQLDNFGYRALQDVDSNLLEIPTVHDQFPITSGPNQGGVVTVVDRAPTSVDGSPDILTPAGDLTPGQVRAYQLGINEITGRSFAWLDNKLDNYAFRRVGPPGSDEWRLVIFDQGGIVPVKSVDEARALQNAIDNPTAAFYDNFFNGPWNDLRRYGLMDEIGKQFDTAVNFDALNQGTGGQFTTLNPENALIDPLTGNASNINVLPYNPRNGHTFPALRDAVAGNGGILPDPLLNTSGLPGSTPLPGAGDPIILPSGFSPGPPPGFNLGLDPSFPIIQPGAMAHVPALSLNDLNVVVGPRLVPFMTRRFIIGACNPDNPPSCQGATGVGVFSFPEEQAPELSQLLQNRPGVAFFDPNPNRFEQIALNDPYLKPGKWDQWAIRRVGYTNDDQSAWDLAKSKTPVIVAVIDTGVAWGHADLGPSQLWINEDEIPGNKIDDDRNGYVDDIVGWNFVEHNNLPWDLDGHGTIVAGIIAARSNNGLGIAGINPDARVMVLRALDAAGRSRASFVAEAIAYAANNGARVINLSVGGRTLTKAESLAVKYAHTKGVVTVAAAGNESVDVTDYGPAGADHVIAVAVTDRDDQRFRASNWGRRVDISAPGVDVLGTRAIGTDLMKKFTDIDYPPGANIVGDDGAYYRVTGTSFSAPIVAATASLIIANNPDLTNVQVERMLLMSARDVAVPGWDMLTGFGLLDARAALQADPDFHVVARIDRIGMIRKKGKILVQVTGSADSSEFDGAWVELGFGEKPETWKKVGTIDTKVKDGVLMEIKPTHFKKKKGKWSLKVVTKTKQNGNREGWGTLNIQ